MRSILSVAVLGLSATLVVACSASEDVFTISDVGLTRFDTVLDVGGETPDTASPTDTEPPADTKPPADVEPPADTPDTAVPDTAVADVPDVVVPPNECTEDITCNDGDGCNGVETCVAFFCQPGTPPSCDDGDPCTDGTCSTGQCQNVDNGTCACKADIDCQDEDACNGDEACIDFQCVAGNAVECSDNNPCNGTEACKNGACAVDPATVPSCSDADPCTNDVCDPATGECVFTDNGACECQADADCVDQTPCDGPQQCVANLCVVDVAGAVDCDDQDPCTADTCSDPDGLCVHTPIDGCDCAVDADCDDANPCNGSEICQDTSCAADVGTAVICDDGDPCTLDSCDPVSGVCMAADNGLCECTTDIGCDDADPCTADTCVANDCIHPDSGTCACQLDSDCLDDNLCNGTEACVANQCVGGQPLVCNDQDPCTDDSCTPATGDCSATDNGQCACQADTDCDDANLCTGIEVCVANDCVAGASVVCDDGSPCTDDACDPLTGGCATTPNDACACQLDADCGDDNACNGVEVCLANQCISGTAVQCADQDPCTTDACDPVDGACSFPDNGSCECEQSAECVDADPCNGSEACVANQCVGGVGFACDDGDPCTADTCLANVGCQHPDNGTCACQLDADCPDADPCDGGQRCVANECVADPTTAIDCDDQDPCTVDSCLISGECSHSAVPDCDCTEDAECDDADPCNGAEICLGNVCAVEDGTTPDCDDLDACTLDACDALAADSFVCSNTDTGICQCTEDVDCDDGLPCTGQEFCSDNQCLSTEPVVCDDNNPCTADSCEAATGQCLHADTGLCECLLDAECDDFNACTGFEQCLSFQCVLGDPVSCDDDDVCTEDFCDPGSGGCYWLVGDVCECLADEDCDDQDACTEAATCDAHQCVGGAPVACDDFNPCTWDFCDPGDGTCVYVDNGQCACQSDSDCDDLDACTGTEVCSSYQCQPGVAVDCSDQDPCTDDTCEPATGQCQSASVICDDSDLCTTDQCDASAGQCTFSPVHCDDGDPCTNDSCDADFGTCSAVDNGLCECSQDAECADSDLCNGQETCLTHVCVAGVPTVCNDDNFCTADSCTAATGVCSSQDNGLCACQEDGDCDDGDFCNGPETCQTYSCVSGVTPTCSDEDTCTVDACSDGGCTHTKLIGCGAPAPFCALSGVANEWKECALEIAAVGVASPPAATLEARFTYDATQLDMYAFTCDDGDSDPCYLLDTTHQGHPLATNPSWSGWNGDVALLIYHPVQPDSVLTTAYLSGGTVVGEPLFVSIQVQLLVDAPPDEPVILSISELFGSTANSAPLSVSHDGSLILTQEAN